ncbi:MAG TPA: energy transducer TonB [Opitutaceae bacterium]|nr:energy transducer TonB [Opitutaceae bacterium]
MRSQTSRTCPSSRTSRRAIRRQQSGNTIIWIRRQSPPHYSSSMIQAGMNGEVIVDFVVDNNGEVRNTTAVRSSNRAFEASAVEAVSKWKFRAGKKGGRFVFTHMQVPIEFNINRE